MTNVPVLNWAIKCPSGTTTNLFAHVDGQWWSIARTPSGAHSGYSAAPGQLTMTDDNAWHEYTFDLSTISGSGAFNAFEFWNDATAADSHVFYVDSINVTHALLETAVRDFDFLGGEADFSDPTKKFPMSA